MAGAVAATGVVALTAALSVALVTAGSAHVVSQRVAAAADSAALAAADAASGAATGLPCERASQIGQALGVEISQCQLDELVATVTVVTTFAGLPAEASARAGPPR
ncbi:Rv3654c family TadE-like protein [Microbacterium sp. NPDC076911]|uniref:Rv3654c family TadE-like protein n=1 Tax=Microbacterium sp. NPDC076911 TaxID=3154958 RepID=UPI00341E2EBD